MNLHSTIPNINKLELGQQRAGYQRVEVLQLEGGVRALVDLPGKGPCCLFSYGLHEAKVSIAAKSDAIDGDGFIRHSIAHTEVLPDGGPVRFALSWLTIGEKDDKALHIRW